MLTRLSSATRIDFTSGAPGFHHFKEFGEETKRLIRAEHTSKIIVIVDFGYELKEPGPHIVLDHLNLTGNNPLVGPNPNCGERFPIVNDIYLNAMQTLDPGRTYPLKEPFSALPTTITAGLKTGVTPAPAELDSIRSLGADSYCYNMVPAMIIAAHAGLKVFGILVPKETGLEVELASQLRGVTR